MIHWYVVGPFETQDGLLRLKEQSYEPALRAGVHHSPDAAFQSLFSTEEDLTTAVKTHRVTTMFGGVAFDYDGFGRDTLEIIRRLVEKFDWVVIFYPFDQRPRSLADLQADIDRREARGFRARR